MATEPSGLRRAAAKVAAAWPPFAILGVALAAWHLAAEKGPWTDLLFPSPAEVAASIGRLVADGSLAAAVWTTLRRLFLGFFAAVGVGAATAFVMARFTAVRAALKPYLLGLQSLPSLAWVPLAILWFGFSEGALIFVTVIGSVFAAALAFSDALSGVPRSFALAARNMGSHGMGLVVRVSAPAALPPIVSGSKQAWSFAWRSLVGAEIIFAGVGLGFLLRQGRDFFDVSQVIAVMLATLIVGLVFEVFAFARAEAWIRRRWGLSDR